MGHVDVIARVMGGYYELDDWRWTLDEDEIAVAVAEGLRVTHSQ